MSEVEKEIKKVNAETVFDFEIIINGVEYPNNIQEDLRLDRTNLVDEFSKHSELYAYYSTLAAMARNQEARIKRITELYYANIDAEKRGEASQLMAQNPKMKFTEKMYEHQVRTDTRFQEVQLKYLDAKFLSDRLSKIEQAFQQRKEMLISLGAHDRVGATDLRALGQQAKRTE